LTKAGPSLDQTNLFFVNKQDVIFEIDDVHEQESMSRVDVNLEESPKGQKQSTDQYHAKKYSKHEIYTSVFSEKTVKRYTKQFYSATSEALKSKK
jgi:hypothetical protein